MSENPYQSPNEINEPRLESKLKRERVKPEGRDFAVGCLMAALVIPAGAIAGGTTCSQATFPPFSLEGVPLGACAGLITAIVAVLGLQTVLHRLIYDRWSWRPNFLGAVVALLVAAPAAHGVFQITYEPLGDMAYPNHLWTYLYTIGIIPFAVVSAALWLGLHWSQKRIKDHL
jgi:hypothetical protein